MYRARAGGGEHNQRGRGKAMNTANFLRIPASMFPEAEILIFENTRLTYGQMLERVQRLASSLQALRVKPGERIAVL